MRTWTKAVAIFWLAYSLYAGISYALGFEPAVQMGSRFALAARFDLTALLVFLAALALLSGKAWGWWVVMVYAGVSGVSFIAVPIAILVMGHEAIVVSGNPVLAFVIAFVVGLLPVAGTIAVLCADPPWKWRLRRAES